MEVVAEKLGFSYLAGGDAEFLQEAFHALELFHWGDVRVIGNVLRGSSEGLKFYVMDYFYRGYGDFSKAFGSTISVIQCSEPLPEFTLEPETLIHKIASCFGFQDVDIAGYPDFSRRYLLRGPDPQAITTFFEGRVALGLGKETGWTVSCIEDWLVLCRIGEIASPEDIEAWLRRVCRVSSLFFAKPSCIKHLLHPA